MAYRAGGEEALASRKAPGPKSKLDARQQERLRRILVGKNPQQLSFPFALWTLPLVGQLVRRLFGVVLHKTTIARMLHRMGLSPQKPTKRAFCRDEDQCLQWTREDFPRIVQQAHSRQATLLFLDESGVHEDGPVDRTWGEKGHRPVVQVTGRRGRINVISAVSPRGRLWFRCYEGTLDAPLFQEFLKGLLHDVRGPIELILDRHPAHVAAATCRFIQQHEKRLRVHHLPPYAPDFNPDEHVWSYLKGLFRRQPLEPEEKLGLAVRLSMEQIQADRSLVRSFFGHPAVAYVKEALHW
jgi:transposase